jgi:hypothetical protein
MIKPFKITSTRQEPDGGTTVFFTVSKVQQISETLSESKSLQTAILVPQGQDIDQYLFDDLTKSGWINA